MSELVRKAFRSGHHQPLLSHLDFMSSRPRWGGTRGKQRTSLSCSSPNSAKSTIATVESAQNAPIFEVFLVLRGSVVSRQTDRCINDYNNLCCAYVMCKIGLRMHYGYARVTLGRILQVHMGGSC